MADIPAVNPIEGIQIVGSERRRMIVSVSRRWRNDMPQTVDVQSPFFHLNIKNLIKFRAQIRPRAEYPPNGTVVLRIFGLAVIGMFPADKWPHFEDPGFHRIRKFIVRVQTHRFQAQFAG